MTIVFWFLDLSHGCPDNCLCIHNQRELLIARCHLDTERDYSSLGHLAANITELECHITERFHEQYFNIRQLTILERLVLRPEKFSRSSSVSKPWTLGFNNTFIFSTTKKLKYLGINLRLVNINVHILQSLENLRVLDLSHTEHLDVTQITVLLQGISTAKIPLDTLNLTRTHVRGVHNGSVFNPINVRTHIYQNLKDIHTLRTLDIRENGVVQQQAGLSEFLPTLEVFYLGKNEFDYFPNGHASILCALLDWMVHPALRKLHYPFVSKSKSGIRKMAFNEVDLKNAIIYGLKQCMVSPMDLCGLSQCICQNEARIPCGFPDNAQLRGQYSNNSNCKGGIQIPFPANLEEVNLEYNNLDLVKIYNCFIATNTKVLLLSGNTLPGKEGIAESAFVNFPVLEILNISQCQMRHAPSFEHLTQLTELDVSQNYLRNFSSNLDSMSRLQKLNLSLNIITHLPDHVTDALDRITENSTVVVDLSDNPLQCVCRTLKFVSWMQNTRVIFHNNRSLLCERSATSPFDINLNEMRNYCNEYDGRGTLFILVALCLLAITAIAIVIGIVINIKKWTIRYWLHVAKENCCRRQHLKLDIENRQYIYDAFVAYCSRDTTERHWVHFTLVPKLETDYGLKLCIHHRDFLPGRDIQDNIVDAISNSRKTLLVLSPSFLDSDWCNFEVRMARVNLAEEQRNNIILVLYRSLTIPGARLPRTLMNLLDKSAYAEWTTDPKGEKLF